MQTREAVEKGVLKGVASRGINPDSMDVSVTSVKFHGKEADAVVSFAPKGGKLSDGLTMQYRLEQKGDDWVITGRSAMNLKQHAGGMQTPPPTMDQNSGAVTHPLPPGHPPLTDNAQ